MGKLVTVTKRVPVVFTVDVDAMQVIDVVVDPAEVENETSATVTPDTNIGAASLAIYLVDRPDVEHPAWRIAS